MLFGTRITLFLVTTTTLALSFNRFAVNLPFSPAQSQTQRRRPSSSLNLPFSPAQSQTQRRRSSSSLLLTKSKSFDFENRRTFDFLSLIEISERTKLQYESTNQSEPLRIYLYLTAAVSLLFSKTLADSVGIDLASSTLLVARVLGVASSFLFVRESGFRRKQLNRLELESNARDLKLTINTVSGGVDRSLRDFDGRNRFLVLRGTKEELKNFFKVAFAYQKRFITSKTLLLCCSTDGSNKADWLPSNSPSPYQWLATVPAFATKDWEAFFTGLLDDGGDPMASCWFGLNSRGRSFGSGLGAPDLLTLFGRSLRPLELMSPPPKVTAASTSTTTTTNTNTNTNNSFSPAQNSVLDAQRQFYAHLTTGDLKGMTEIFSSESSESVQKIIDTGGGLDTWAVNLQDGARPENLSIFDSDVFIDESETSAYSTNVESMDGAFSTLLALQRWILEDGDWKLLEHSTIPWTVDSAAAGTLKCDRRGCVALTKK